MKILKYIIILLLLTKSLVAQNTFNAGIFVGLSSTQVGGDGLGGFDKTGFLIGGLINRNINEKWSWQGEIMYIQKGSQSKHYSDSSVMASGIYAYRMSLSYMEVPLLLRYY